MKFVIFCHSLESDWNHGNAHFIRGVVTELMARDHEVVVYEPVDGWSRSNLVVEHGRGAISDFRAAFPHLRSRSYDVDDIDRDVADMTAGADIVIVHEWSEPAVVAACGRHRREAGYRLLFHDTHHRMVTEPGTMAAFDLSRYDGVLAFGAVITQLYLERGLVDRAWTWHEAADTNTFHPIANVERRGDLIWIGNWGDGERADELRRFLIEPVRRLSLRAQVYGVRYPDGAQHALSDAGIRYRGWTANHRAPAAFAAHEVTVHVPRRPYTEALPGIPTIRPFEALACGIPLVSAPWDDAEHLFRPGMDFLVASNGGEMERHLDDILHDPDLADSLRVHGLETVLGRHTCGHRVDELLKICAELGAPSGEVGQHG
jgi:spore maturation protein CgeB